MPGRCTFYADFGAIADLGAHAVLQKRGLRPIRVRQGARGGIVKDRLMKM
jgi:hypothetical protein